MEKRPNEMYNPDSYRRRAYTAAAAQHLKRTNKSLRSRRTQKMKSTVLLVPPSAYNESEDFDEYSILYEKFHSKNSSAIARYGVQV